MAPFVHQRLMAPDPAGGVEPRGDALHATLERAVERRLLRCECRLDVQAAAGPPGPSYVASGPAG